MKILVHVFVFFCSCLFPLISKEQSENVTAAFIGPDSICNNTPVQFTNRSSNASNYYWSFCAAGFNTTPIAKNLGNPGNHLQTPVFMDYALDDNGNYYGFISNYANGHIVKLNYGNSLLNTPTATDLGNFGIIPIYTEGIQVKKGNGKCYVFVVAAGDAAGSKSALFKLDFGSSFSNTPNVSNLGNLGNLLFPHDLFITQEGNNFYGFTISINNNTITRFDFGNSLSNQPTGTNLGAIGNMNYPCGFSFINNNGNWYAFVTNRDNNSITRLNFGNSLKNKPTGNNIGNPGSFLNRPRDISIFESCNDVVGLVVNEENEQTGTITKLDFGGNLLLNPQATNLGNLGKLKFPHSISKFFLEGNDIYSFITNVSNNTLTRLRYTGCTSINISSSTQQTPPAVSYSEPGIYNVDLLVDIGLPTETSFCKQIVVKDCTPPVVADFTGPDTVCTNAPVKITNTSVNATTYYWSFCEANLNQSPSGSNLGNINSTLSLPVYSDIVSQNGNYYVFVVNNYPGSVTRFNFGNSLINTPSAIQLGNFGSVLKNNAEGIQIVNTGNHWYGIIVGGDPTDGVTPQIIKLDFGTDITSISPVVTDWGNIGNMSYPHELYVFNENNNWYGFTANYGNNTITRFNFGQNFSNPPTGSNLGSFGILSGPTGISPIKDNTNWYLFITNGTNNTIARLNFGNSLLSTPTAVSLGNLNGTLHECWDISIQKYCDEILGFVVNGDDNYNDIIRLNFNNDLLSVPTATSLRNIGSLSFPHSFSKLFRVGNDLYNFIPNAHNNTLTRLKFSGCTNSNISGTSQKDPSVITYDSAGVYNINLTIDEGLPTQTTYCKQIIVKNCDTICNLNAGFTYEQNVCDPTTIQFTDTTSNADSIWWNFDDRKTAGNIKNPNHQYGAFGNYTVKLFAKTNTGCLDTATITINVNIKNDSAIVNHDTAICKESSIQFNAVKGLSYCWSPSIGLSDSTIQNPIATPKVTTKYYLHILTAANQPITIDSITITVLTAPVVNAGKDVSICKGATVQLNASGVVKYNWNASNFLSDTTIANPLAFPVNTTSFIVKGYDAKGCWNKDTVKVSVLSLPVITLTNDTGICKGGSVMLQATKSNYNVYNWYPSVGLSTTNSNNTIASPADTIKYFVTVTDNNNCKSTDSITVNVLSKPQVTVMNDTSICKGDSIILKTTTANASIFEWQPQTGLNDPYIQNPWASPASSTAYTITAGNGICSEKASVLISILSLPSVITSNDTTVCGNASAQLNSFGAALYSWYPITGLSNPNISNPVATPGFTTIYYVKGTANNSCTNIDSVIVKVNPPPVFHIEPLNTSLCFGDSLLLIASGGDIYNWSPAVTLTNTSAANTEAHPLQNTTYKVTITNSVCEVTSSLTSTVVVKDIPVVTINKSNDVDCINLEAQLEATGGRSYRWLPIDYISNIYISNPKVYPPVDTKYFVTVKDENGCTSKDSILVKSTNANAADSKFEIPTAFTPNNDDLNDCFSVHYLGTADVFNISIYNRWGQLIFYSKDLNNCWNGIYKGIPQPAGAYVYIINISSRCTNGLIQKKGTVILIR